MAVNLTCGSTGLGERRGFDTRTIVAAFVDQLRFGRLDARAEHARGVDDLLLRHRLRQLRVGLELADFAGGG